MRITKKIVASVLALTLVIGTMTGVSAAVVDATNTVPNKAKLENLVNEFSIPIGVTELYGMKAGFSQTLNFAAKGKTGAKARGAMLRYKAEKKSQIQKYSKRMFGVKTSGVTIYPGEWGQSQPTLVITSIKKTSSKNYYVKGEVAVVDSTDSKKHECGTFKLYVQKNSKAKYKYYATKLFLSTWKQATTKASVVNLFSGAKKYKNIKATMTYQKITVSGVDGAKAINTTLNNDMNAFQKSKSANNFYQYVAEDDAKKIKDNYFFKATSKVKYNMNNILSIRITINWYAGGAQNSDEYGYNFNVKTGKQIQIKNVVPGSTNAIKKKMYAGINTRKWSKAYKKKAKKIIKKAKLKDLEFYMKNDKVIICFEPYMLGKKQRDFKSFYIYSKYF